MLPSRTTLRHGTDRGADAGRVARRSIGAHVGPGLATGAATAIRPATTRYDRTRDSRLVERGHHPQVTFARPGTRAP